MLVVSLACGLHRIERLMPSDTGVHSTNAVTPTVLNRTFDAASAKHEWVTHFTYLWTVEGWRYVAAIVDLFSRRGAGWSMRAAMTAQLVTEALVMAIWRPGYAPTVLPQSDRGSSLRVRRSNDS